MNNNINNSEKENKDMNDLILSMFNEDNINNLPDNVVNALADRLYRQSVKNQFLQLTNRLNNVEGRVDNLEIDHRQTVKTVQMIEHREQKRKEIEDCFHEPSEIAKYLFNPDEYPVLFSMSGQLINLFYFGFGLLSKNLEPTSSCLADSLSKCNTNEKIFYAAVKKNKRNTFIYYPANVAKVKEIFEIKLKEYGLLNEFYNAKDKDELRLIASYLSALRLNKQYLKDGLKIDIDGLKDNPKELIRIVKNHFVEFRKEKDDKENQDC